MKFRIFLTIVVIIVMFFSMQLFNQRVSPTLQADLAVQQIEDPGASAAMRIAQDTQNASGIVVLLVAISFGALIWKTPIIKAWKETFEVVSDCNAENKSCGCKCNTESDKKNS
jgi:hypothetical protein